MTINEVLYDAIKYEETVLAYSLYWYMQQGLCRAHDSFKSFDAHKVDPVEVHKLIADNPLGIQTMKLFSMPTAPGFHLIVFAEDEKAARGHYLNERGALPKVIHDMTNKMDTSFWYGKEQGYKTFRQVRDETLMFPATVMEYNKNQKTLEEIEYEYRSTYRPLGQRH